MKNLKLYLAHSLKCRFRIRKIELELENKYNIELLNPFYDVYRPEILKMDKHKQNRFDFTLKQCKRIRKRDLDLIMQCDGLLCIIFNSYRMIGSFKEMCYAFENNKPVFLISYEYYAREHLWNKAESCKRFKNIKCFENWLKSKGYEKNENVEIKRPKRC